MSVLSSSSAARRTALAAAVLAGLWAASTAALAQGAGMGQACKADAGKLCPGVQPGGGRVLACLKQHEAELSPDCQAALPRLSQCAAQVQQLCGQGKPREMRNCLKDHREELGAACQGGAQPG